jgi:hypothetical protein
MLSATNPMGRVLMTLLIFEAVTIGLAIPVMIMVSSTPLTVAILAGGGAAVLAVAAAGTLRRPRVGYPLGWATQAAALALGFLTFGMVLMGAMFACLWAVCFVLGRRLEIQQAASR